MSTLPDSWTVLTLLPKSKTSNPSCTTTSGRASAVVRLSLKTSLRRCVPLADQASPRRKSRQNRVPWPTWQLTCRPFWTCRSTWPHCPLLEISILHLLIQLQVAHPIRCTLPFRLTVVMNSTICISVLVAPRPSAKVKERALRDIWPQQRHQTAAQATSTTRWKGKRWLMV